MEYLNSFVEQKKNDGTKEFARFFSKEDFDEGLEEALISIISGRVPRPTYFSKSVHFSTE